MERLEMREKSKARRKRGWLVDSKHLKKWSMVTFRDHDLMSSDEASSLEYLVSAMSVWVHMVFPQRTSNIPRQKRSFFSIDYLNTFEGDFELKRIEERTWIVQNDHITNVHFGHASERITKVFLLCRLEEPTIWKLSIKMVVGRSLEAGSPPWWAGAGWQARGSPCSPCGEGSSQPYKKNLFQRNILTRLHSILFSVHYNIS